MQLQTLYNLANIFSTHTYIHSISRIDDNVIAIRLDDTHYCIDLCKSNPSVYIKENPLKTKSYNAPFDIALHKYLSKAKIQQSRLDGMNKIIILVCQIKNKYKEEIIYLHLEFINRSTNAIIVSDNRIVSALRFSNANRVIMPKAPFVPVPQPHFTKKLVQEEKAAFLQSLRQHYQVMQDSLLEQKRSALLQTLQVKCRKLESILNSLPPTSQLECQRDTTLLLANYILAHLDEIAPYSTEIAIDNIHYEIPKESKPSIASQKLFQQSKKLKQKIAHIHLQRENLESKITFLYNQMSFVRCANLEELNILRQKKAIAKSNSKKQFENFYVDGICISIGRNESENIRLLQMAKADFLWMHLRDIPSSHLIIHANKVNPHILEYAGIILARLCGIKDNKTVIDYTRRRFVKILQGANVVYSKEKTLHLHLE
ncbi:NFACT family protein [Helicobacter sp. MIT 14-3879]|uniref:NFACT family protein n=1 Tax=Helicobacter sp. MIT 14-3879 TaxID=2040649 RepID=UPI000E1E81F5|nr:NFACT family protein [Helicobacter sp. MIT 14-3879]RDU61525.1 DUF814 domain-containing protein [Helicobacter sp. MIT 14-3879]